MYLSFVLHSCGHEMLLVVVQNKMQEFSLERQSLKIDRGLHINPESALNLWTISSFFPPPNIKGMAGELTRNNRTQRDD